MRSFHHVSFAFALALAAIACGPKPAPSSGGTGGDDSPRVGDGSSVAPPDVVASSDLPPVLTKPLAGDPMAVSIHRLSNGMTVFISTNRDKPRISSWIAVRAGSRHDPASSTGLAHYLEHMLFKGSTRLGTLDFDKERPHLARIEQLYKDLRAETDNKKRDAILAEIDAETQKTAKFAIPNEFDQLYAGLGIEGINAFTSDEQTVYIADVPSNRFAAWARVEGDRFTRPQFRLFYPELEAVYEEKNRTLDQPLQRLNETMLLALYPSHPYGTQPTIGQVEHLKNPAYQDMVEFFHTWYVPNNMAIVLAGDIDARTALPLLEAEFGKMKPAKLPAVSGAKLEPVRGRTEREIEAEGEQSIYLAWRTVGMNSDDEPAIQVMDWLVDNSVTGLLNLDLILTQKLPRAGSFPTKYIEAGHWVVWGTARDGQRLDEVESLLVGVVDKLKKGEFSQADIDAIVINAEIADKMKLESNDSRVSEIAEAYVHHTPWEIAATRTERLRKVTREDVIRAASRYLGSDLIVVRRVQGKHQPPKITKPKITPIGLDTSRESAFAREVRAMEALELSPQWLVEGEHYTRHQLASGPMIAVKNPRNDLFQVSYVFPLGSKRQRLLCHALDLLDRSGAAGMSAVEVKRKLYGMGSTIETDCNVDETTINVSGLDRNLEASVALLDSWLRTAVFSADDVSKLATNEISRRKDMIGEASFVASALHEFAIRGKSSRFLQVPSNRELKAAKGPALAKLLAALPDQSHWTSYFGPRAGTDAVKAAGLGKKPKKPLPPRDPARFRTAKGTAAFFTNKQAAQAQIRFAVPDEAIANDERIVAQLYSEYIGGGMGSLIFQEIREARGLAYSAWAAFASNPRAVDQAALIGGVGTQADKTVDALDAMLTLLGELKIEPARFKVAKDSLDQQFRASRVDPRWAASWVRAWDELGYKSDPRPAEWEALRKLDPATLTAFARKAAEGSLLVGVMADASRVDMRALEKKLGKIQKIKIEKLVGY